MTRYPRLFYGFEFHKGHNSCTKTWKYRIDKKQYCCQLCRCVRHFFFLFVITYIFKCVRKAVQTSAIRENRSQAQYKSLSFNEIEPKILAISRVEPHEQRKEDSTYLSPVVSRNECSTSCDFGEIENNLLEATLYSQRPSDETTNVQIDPENTQNEVQVHVYVEITEDNTESWNMDVDLNCKTTEANNTVHRGRCISPREPSGSRADIQRPMGCDLENAMS